MNAMGSIRKLLTGATAATRELNTAVDQLRAKRLAVLDERDRLQAMPHERATILEALDRDLDQMVERARDALYTPALLRGERGPEFRAPHADALIGLLVAANRTAFTAQIEAVIDEALGDAEVMPTAEREAALRKLADDLADLERAEEALIRSAEAEGLTILRREDADADVLLLADQELE